MKKEQLELESVSAHVNKILNDPSYAVRMMWKYNLGPWTTMREIIDTVKQHLTHPVMKQGLNATELKAYRTRIMYALMNISSLIRMIEHYVMLSSKALLDNEQDNAWAYLCKAYEKVSDYDALHEDLRSVLMDMDKDLEVLDPESHTKLLAELSTIMSESNK